MSTSNKSHPTLISGGERQLLSASHKQESKITNGSVPWQTEMALKMSVRWQQEDRDTEQLAVRHLCAPQGQRAVGETPTQEHNDFCRPKEKKLSSIDVLLV